MAVQTTVTTAYRSHAVEGLNGFVSMRTSVAFRPGRSECRIGANQVVGPLTGEASGFIGSGVRCIGAFFVHSAKRARTGRSGTHAGQFATVVMAGRRPSIHSSCRGIWNRVVHPLQWRGVQFSGSGVTYWISCPVFLSTLQTWLQWQR